MSQRRNRDQVGAVQPGLDWYKAQSKEAGVLPRCPFAAVERCPRFYQSISLLGESGVTTSLDPAEDERLLKIWKSSGLWPQIREQATSVHGPSDNPKHFLNFCPEVAFDRFGHFATNLSRHADEIDSDVAARQLANEGAARNDWRRAWALAMPMHYTDCPLYSLLMASGQFGLIDKAQGPNKPVRLGHSRSMFSLLVSGNPAEWNGKPFELNPTRFLKFTDDEVVKTLGDFGEAALNRLLRLPCIFAYEDDCQKDPLFGIVTRVVPRARDIRVEYEIIAVDPFLTQQQFRDLQSELAIDRTEYFQHHWAVKEVDLRRALEAIGIALPPTRMWQRPANVTTHEFDAALSFPGETRPFVKQVADCLDLVLGTDRCFYDDNYKAQLARPDLDLLLQQIYGKRSRLVVVFLCEAYESKPWCGGVEFRVVREMIKARQHEQVMFVRMDEGTVGGVFSVDGAIDGRKHSPEDIARMVQERVGLLST